MTAQLRLTSWDLRQLQEYALHVLTQRPRRYRAAAGDPLVEERHLLSGEDARRETRRKILAGEAPQPFMVRIRWESTRRVVIIAGDWPSETVESFTARLRQFAPIAIFRESRLIKSPRPRVFRA